MIQSLKFTILLGFLFVLFQVQAQDVPSKMTYQGIFYENGSPFTGTKNFVFTIGAWTETQNNVNIEDGRYAVILGAVNPLTVSTFEGMANVELQIQVDGSNLSPNIVLLTVPYSFYAQKAKEAEKATTADNAAPIGTVVAYMGTTAPDGWLLCDGATISRTTYADLFAVVGESCGQGDGSSTFHLPDFRGRFLRMVDGTGGADRDPDSGGRTAMNAGGNTGNNVGSIQEDELKEHNHAKGTLGGNTSTNGNHSHSIVWNGRVNGYGSGNYMAHDGKYNDDRSYTSSYTTRAPNRGLTNSTGNHSHTLNITGNTANFGGNETRPKNAYVNYIIKWK